MGRYYQPDPVGLASGDVNLYRYVSNGPLGSYDPYGLYDWGSFGSDIGAFAIGIGDAASFGLTRWIRQQEWYGGDPVNYCSGWYTAGGYVGEAAAYSLAGTAAGRLIARSVNLAEIASKYKYLRQFTQQHHPFPRWLSGPTNKRTMTMFTRQHRALHRDLMKFLKTNYPELVPKRGYAGARIREAYSESRRLEAMLDFYLGPGNKYTHAAVDFFMGL